MDINDLKALVEPCSVARHLLDQDGCHDVMTAFNIANHLHLHSFFREAAIFYQEAINYRRAEPDGHPQESLLLQVKLLCLIKADVPLDEEDRLRLGEISPSLENYISGIERYYRNAATAVETMERINCTFEQFHTGEEIDAIYASLIYRGLEEHAFPDIKSQQMIPRRLFFYWDANIPEDVAANIQYHQGFENYSVELFDQEKAAEWLYSYYGREAQSIFLKARHPAEAADILRVHVMNIYGGFWVDADLKIASEQVLEDLIQQQYDTVFFLTDGNYIHNDFFGVTPNNIFLEDCLLSIYRNCYQFESLFISYKTGPGVFMRALNRTYYRCLKRIMTAYPSLKLLTPAAFSMVTEQYPVNYKNTGTWTAV